MALLGDKGVGKTALVIQFCHYQFVGMHESVEDSYRKRAMVDSEALFLDFYDTIDEEPLSELKKKLLRNSLVFILVYSITQRSSFESLQQRYNELLELIKPQQVLAVIVGNKADLEPQRQVTHSEGKAFASQLDAPFCETSAKTRTNVDETVHAAVRLIWKFNIIPRPVRPPQKSCCVLL